MPSSWSFLSVAPAIRKAGIDEAADLLLRFKEPAMGDTNASTFPPIETIKASERSKPGEEHVLAAAILHLDETRSIRLSWQVFSPPLPAIDVQEQELRSKKQFLFSSVGIWRACVWCCVVFVGVSVPLTFLDVPLAHSGLLPVYHPVEGWSGWIAHLPAIHP